MGRVDLLPKLWEIIEPVVTAEGMELVEVEFQRETRGWVLRLYIDRPDGVTLEDCVSVSRQVGDVLDVKDPIDHPYHLEVSSPGLDRPLRKPKDFERFSGSSVKLTLSEPVDGHRVLRGTLLGLKGEVLGLRWEDRTLEIPLGKVLKARLIYSWDGESRKR